MRFSAAQQERAISELTPLLLLGRQLQDRLPDAGDGSSEYLYLSQAINAMVGEMQQLMLELEMSHSQSNVLDAEEVEVVLKVLAAEIRALSSRLRSFTRQTKIKQQIR